VGDKVVTCTFSIYTGKLLIANKVIIDIDRYFPSLVLHNLWNVFIIT
jgi:hypothetical protein